MPLQKLNHKETPEEATQGNSDPKLKEGSHTFLRDLFIIITNTAVIYSFVRVVITILVTLWPSHYITSVWFFFCWRGLHQVSITHDF